MLTRPLQSQRNSESDMLSSASSFVTPRRRRRRREDEDTQDTTESQDATSTQAGKRRRVENDSPQMGSDDDSGDEDAVLPDSFRRSPKGKGRASTRPRTMATGHEQLVHKSGTIVRVTMKQFVTYTWAEFKPGPGLNMIIGPNGTGKSTLVCAICLGLGSQPHHLGRAKDISEFVKHGYKEGTIEIELKADPERHRSNPVITCKIARDGGKDNVKKTTFSIDGQKSTNKAVLELVRSFSIQVDNLCQFLPQDRVVEFAALSPVELLAQTQRAAAPEYMTEWHEQLKAMRKEEKQKLGEQQSGIDDLKRLEDRQRAQEGEVERMRERTIIQEKLAVLNKFRPFAEFNELKANHEEAKTRRKQAAKEHRELERRAAPNLQSLENKKAYLAQVSKAFEAQEKLLNRTKRLVTDALVEYNKQDKNVRECDDEMRAEKASGAAAKQNIARYQNQIRETRKAMENRPANFDAEAMNRELAELKRELRAVEQQLSEQERTVENLKEQARQRQELIKEEENKKVHLQSQAGRLASKLDGASADTGKAWKWIQDNLEKFAGEVFGPPMISCSVENSTHAGWVESMMGEAELKAITVTKPEDFKMLSHQVFANMRLTDVSIRSSTQSLAGFKPAMSDEQLNQLGLEGWLMDLIEGPDPVLAMLCDNRNLHMTPYATKDISDAQLEALKQSAIGGWVTPEKSWRIVRRREYGAAGMQTRVEPLRKARLLTDAPVNTQAEEEAEEKISQAKRDIDSIRDEMKGTLVQFNKHRADYKQLQGRIDDIGKDKRQKQEQLTRFQGLEPKLQGQEQKHAGAVQQIADLRARLQRITDRKQSLIFEKAQKALNHAKAIGTLRSQYQALLETEIMRIEAKSDVDQLEERNHEETKMLQDTKAEVERLRTSEGQLLREGKHKQAECQRLGPEFDRLGPELDELKDRIRPWKPSELDPEIASVQASLDMLAGAGNANLIKEFEERAQKIARKKATMSTLQANLSELTNKIEDIQSNWEPRLDALVLQISNAFAENFSRIQCAGEVSIDKHEDFDQWAIQIKVKFRENEQLSILDSHRQSGGERAVSTIFYLMALQSLARAPFRVVDEINQGMDPRNERLVHARMVDIACAENTSQYFLITPKLLNNLKYHPNMKVHCIASGEYMPGREDQLDTFETLAQAALAIKASA